MSEQSTIPAWQRRDYWLGYSADVTDDEARERAARKLAVSPGRIELRRNGGGVLARVREETK